MCVSDGDVHNEFQVWLRIGDSDLVEDSVICHNLSRSSSCPLVFVIGGFDLRRFMEYGTRCKW